MEKTSRSYVFDLQERKIIKQLIDKQYGKISTSIDYKSEGDYDYGLEAKILAKTQKRISGSTLERLVGLLPKEINRGISFSKLDTVSNYLEYSNIAQLVNRIIIIKENPSKEIRKFKPANIFKIHITKIKLENNKELSLRYLPAIKSFEVIKSKNLKILTYDIIEISLLEIGHNLECNNVERIIDNSKKKLGLYTSGYNNKVIEISFTK